MTYNRNMRSTIKNIIEQPKRAIKIQESCALPAEFKQLIELLAHIAALDFLAEIAENKTTSK